MNNVSTVQFDFQEKKQDLSTIANDVYEVLFENGEMSLLEVRIDPTLLEKVHRAIIRMEENPHGVVRNAEELLYEIADPYLAIAILRKAFLIKSNYTVESIQRQLFRLLKSPDKKTSNLSMKALKEAAYSEIERLQNIACQALFKSSVLEPDELLEFSRENLLYFQYRIMSVYQLLDYRSKLAAEGFTCILSFYDRNVKNNKELTKYQDKLFAVANKFELLQSLNKEDADGIIEELFNFSDNTQIDNKTKKIVQRAMASLPDITIRYLKNLPLDQKSNPAVIYSLGACSRITPLATMELIQTGIDLIEAFGETRSNSLLIISHQLSRVKNEGCQQGLKDFIKLVKNETPSLFELQKNLERVDLEWQTGEKQVSLQDILTDLEPEYEVYPDIDETVAKQVRHFFEIGYQKIQLSALSQTHREILFRAMETTALDFHPSRNSWSFWISHFDELSLAERLIIMNVLGFTALSKKLNITKSKDYSRLESFFEKYESSKIKSESELASYWIRKLTGEVRPN